jgi:hypothetical protein
MSAPPSTTGEVNPPAGGGASSGSSPSDMGGAAPNTPSPQ